MSAKPKATLESSSVNRSVWRIAFPSTLLKEGAVYFATTYPNSDLIFLETGAKRHPLSNARAPKIVEAARQAIGDALKASRSPARSGSGT
jgi:hypothetical protein